MMTAGEQVLVMVAMMVVMMLPAAAPAVVRLHRAQGQLGGNLRFVVSYAMVWALAGFALSQLWRPHDFTVAGLLTVAAAAYELTPFKRFFRRRCQEVVSSGVVFGLYCLGSCLGLMLMLAALGVMSVAWMTVVAVIVFVQKVVPPSARLDVSLALAIAALGVAVVVAPSSIPALATT